MLRKDNLLIDGEENGQETIIDEGRRSIEARLLDLGHLIEQIDKQLAGAEQRIAVAHFEAV